MSLHPHALLIASGVKEAAIKRLVSQLGTLAQIAGASPAELRAAGIPERTAERLSAAFSFARTVCAAEVRGRETISQAVDVWEHLRVRIPTSQEAFYVLPVDVRNGLLDVVEVARGTVCGVEVHPREVFRPAIRVAAAGIIIAHNHPSGDPTPSKEDVELTRRLRDAGTTIGIPVVDHVVVTQHSFRSISEWLGTEL